MAIDLDATSVICSRCGKTYGRRKGYFPVNYGSLYKGIGYLTVCKSCVDSMYDTYLAQCGDAKTAVRQVCRKLDLYWNDNVYEIVARKNTQHTMMTGYIAKINTVSYSGKSYDDTLSKEGTLWAFSPKTEEGEIISAPETHVESVLTIDTQEEQVDESIVRYWGSGYTPAMYAELEERKKNWVEGLTKEGIKFDFGTESIVKQICALELDIVRDRANGKPVDKSLNALNTLLGSAALKPTQKKSDDLDAANANTPLGVWLYRYENKRPLPDIDDEFKDVNKIRRYVFTWMGHLCKMLNLKNGYSKLYEEEVEKYRVEKPSYDGDDEELFEELALSDNQNGGEGNDEV